MMSVSARFSTAFLIATLIILCGVHGQDTYWIAPNTTQCGGRTPCQTLESYVSNNASLFSRSHTTWVFLQGDHILRARVDFMAVTNVTLTGEYSCSDATREQCSNVLVTPTNLLDVNCKVIGNYGWRIPNISSRCPTFSSLHFIHSGNISLYNLNFNRTLHSFKVLDSNDTKYSTLILMCCRKWYDSKSIDTSNILVFERVHNVVLTSVKMVAHADFRYFGKAVGMISDPSGEYLVSDSRLGRLNNIIVTVTENIELKYSMKIFNTFLETFGLLATQDHVPRSMIFLVFENSHLSGERSYIEIKKFNVHLEIKNCTFWNHGLFIEGNDTRLDFTCLKCTFQEVNEPFHISCVKGFADIKVILSQFINGSGPILTVISNYLTVELKDVTFIENKASRSSHVISVMPTSNTTGQFDSMSSVSVDNCVFCHNWLYSYQIYIGYFSKYNPATVVFKGRNVIQNNTGGGVYLNSGVMWIQGDLHIEDNGYHDSVPPPYSLPWSSATAVLKIEGASLIQFSNNTQMSIKNNEGYGIYLTEYVHPEFHHYFGYYYYNKYFNTITHKKACFLRLVYDKGTVVTEQDLEYFNTSLVVSGNFIPKYKTDEQHLPDKQLYHTHLHNCEFILDNTTKIMKEKEMKKYLKLDSWDRTTIGSPPYYMCSCDATQPENKILWKCGSGSIFRVLYPGVPPSLALVTLGENYFVQPANITIRPHNRKTAYYNTIIDECIEIPLKFQSYTFQLIARGLLAEGSVELNMNIYLQVLDYCPPGMNITWSNNTRVCGCKESLASHWFDCSIKVDRAHGIITYKSTRNGYWMGYWNDRLVFSNFCPSYYCNSTVLTTGITLEGINTTIQCNPDSNRQGLLCSQCTPGTSSQFGSFRCTPCTFAGLLLVPLGVVAGIVLILFLFLFNFTVLQGDIVGIAFYANVVSVMDEFLLKYSRRPFYIPLSLINLNLGFETCFFDGTDEFSKAIVQFMFPFYLLSLLAIIIIAAHKYNLKIFRVRFVARRSVPVLATIMLLTYSSLINAVIYGLQYTTIYNANTGTPQVVWLQQPELEYFRSRHIAVGVLCLLVLLFYLLPLTIVTLFGDLLRMCTRNLWFSHFLDVFHGAFRYPFGFWFGTRLLLRIIFITLSIALKTPVVAYAIFLTTGAIILLQFLLEPFRTDNVIIYRPDPERKMTRRDFIKARVSKIFRPKIIDSLFLFNIMFMATAVLGSTEINPAFTTVGVCLSISLALAQLVAVTVHHTYHYFPLPDSTPQRMEELRERFAHFRERMRERRRAPRNQADTQDTAPVQIHYLSASMCFNSEEYTSSSSSSGEESDSERNGETRHSTTML